MKMYLYDDVLMQICNCSFVFFYGNDWCCMNILSHFHIKV